MELLMLLIPILLPIAGGSVLFFHQFTNEKTRNLYLEIIALLTSVLIWFDLYAYRGVSRTLYSFTRGFSITFCIDGMGMLFAALISVMWPMVLLYAFSYMRGEQRGHRFFAFYIGTYGVTLGVAFAGNITTLYVFYEMLSLITIPLVTYYGNHESMYAGRKYAAYTIGGASLTFFAVVAATLYGENGTFLYGGSLLANADVSLMRIAFLFAFFGFGTKAAVFPLYAWLPTASAAPTPVTALLHAVAVVNSGVFAVIRITWYLFGTDILIGSYAQNVGLAAAEFTLLFAAVMAVRERHFKKRLAYSTISNLSYMLFGIMLMTPEGFLGGISHMLFHSVIKMTLFLCAGAFMHNTEKNYIYELNGVGKRMPVTFVCYTIAALSLTGIPLLCGFVSKWTLLNAGADAGTTLGIVGVCCLIVSAFLCAIYTLTVSIRAFFPMAGMDRFANDTKTKDADLNMKIPIIFFTVVNLLFGMFSGHVIDWLSSIASGLI